MLQGGEIGGREEGRVARVIAGKWLLLKLGGWLPRLGPDTSGALRKGHQRTTEDYLDGHVFQGAEEVALVSAAGAPSSAQGALSQARQCRREEIWCASTVGTYRPGNVCSSKIFLCFPS